MARNFGIVTILALAILTGCGGGPKAPPPSVAGPSSGAAPSNAMTVVLQSPSLGTVGTPIPIQASASSPNGISGWVVYADDKAAVTLNNSSNSLSTSLPLAAGAHIFYVRVWDAGGTNFVTSPTLAVNVDGTQATVSAAGSTPPIPSAPAPGPLPAVPGSAEVFDSIQNSDGWQSCSGCAGGSPTSNFWTAASQSSPSLSGSSREFFIGGQAFSNALWYDKVVSGHSGIAHFLWDFWVRFDSTSSAHAHSAEYDIWQVINGQEFMMGSQCNFENGVWDVWDSKNFAWKPTSVGCKRFSPDTWHHIQWYIERWGSNQYHYGVLVVDGNAHPLDRAFNTNSVGREDSVGVQFQLDQDKSGTPLHEWVDNVKLSIW
jgi:hypothetical protein